MTDAQRLTCQYCESDETIADSCQHCRNDHCRSPKLNDRLWTLSVTSNRMFPTLTKSNLIAFAENACCRSITAFDCPTALAGGCQTYVGSSGLLRYHRYDKQVLSQGVQKSTNRAVPPGLLLPNCCTCNDSCLVRFRSSRACVQGYLFGADIAFARLFITRTTPRYTCEPDRCQYRLALVVEGRIGLTFGTHLLEGQSRELVADTSGFCGNTPNTCLPSGTTGTYPIPTPPVFNSSLFSITAVTWRRVYRATTDVLEFPITFAAGVSATCGPQCAETITESIPTISTMVPSLVCDPIETCEGCCNCCDGTWDVPDFGIGPTECVSIEDCPADCGEGATGTSYQGGAFNTFELDSTSGIVTVGSLPSVLLPDSFEVTLS
jgi:hypothetical protein